MIFELLFPSLHLAFAPLSSATLRFQFGRSLCEETHEAF
jgi:hypothetical protein